jgi:citrate synthase
MAMTEKSFNNVFNVKAPKWRTSITRIESNKITTRGYSQDELIENLSFSEMVYLLIKGDMPSKNESKMFNAILVSFGDHGLTPPSTQSARIIASGGSSLQYSVAGGLLAFGKNHAGAIEHSMNLLQTRLKKFPDKNVCDIAEFIVEDYFNKSEKIPGFGHRFHYKDPRAAKILELAEKYDCIGIHTSLALAIQDILSEKKDIYINIDGANASLLLDLGFDSNVGVGIFMIGRLPGLVAHVIEEQSNEVSFKKFIDIDDIIYDGDNSK